MSALWLCCDPYPTKALALIRSLLNKPPLRVDLLAVEELTPSTQDLKDCQGLLIRSCTRITKNILDSSPQLKFIGTATSGRDHIDLKECEQRNIKIFSAPDGNSQSAAEHTLLLMLAQARQLPIATQSLRNNRWRSDCPRGYELKGKHLGIVGLGRVGSKVASMARGMGMHVSACDPYVEETRFQELKVQRLGFTEILRQSEIISFHVPLTSETKHMINRPTLEHLDPSAKIINTSRGDVIDENELILWLESTDHKEKQPNGAALDVFAKEPLPIHSRLLDHPRVILTPHIGAYTNEAFESSGEIVVRQAIDFFRSI